MYLTLILNVFIAYMSHLQKGMQTNILTGSSTIHIQPDSVHVHTEVRSLSKFAAGCILKMEMDNFFFFKVL